MSKHYDINISFPWKNNNDEEPKEETIIEDFYGVKFLASLIKNEKKDKLGIKIKTISEGNFSVKVDLDILINHKKIDKTKPDSFDLVFSKDDNKQKICLSKKISEIQEYLVSKGRKKDSKQLEINFLMNIVPQEIDDESDESSYDSHHKISKRTTLKKKQNDQIEMSKTQAKKDKSSKSTKENISQNQAQLIRKKKDDYSDEEDPKLIQKAHSSKLTKKTQKKKKDDEYDSDEYKNEIPEKKERRKTQTNKKEKEEIENNKYGRTTKPTKSHTQKSHYQYSDDDSDQNSIQKEKSSKRDIKKKKEDEKEENIRHSRKNHEFDSDDIEKSDGKHKKALLGRHKKKDEDENEERNQTLEKSKATHAKSSNSIVKNKKHDEFEEEEQKEASKTREEQKRKTRNSQKQKEEEEDEDDRRTKSTKSKSTHSKSSNSIAKGKKHGEFEEEIEEKAETKKKSKKKAEAEAEERNQTLKKSKTTHAKSQNAIARDESGSEDGEERRGGTHMKTRSKARAEEERERRKKEDDGESAPREKKEGRSSKKKASDRRANKEEDDDGEYEPGRKKRSGKAKDKKYEDEIPESSESGDDAKKKRSGKAKDKKYEDENIESSESEEDAKKKKKQQSNKTKAQTAKDKVEDSSSASEEDVKKKKQISATKSTKREDKARGSSTDDESSSDAPSCPFIGLSNLGATCYMNSAIQALFHTPLFRKTVLTFDTGITNANDISAVKNAQNKCKLILIHLQSLFLQMIDLMNSQSQKKFRKDFISTAQLARSFGWTEQEISTQQDVNEFIINFFQVLDECSKSQTKEKVDDGSITGMFKGQIITSITRKSDGKLVLHSFEDFYDFSLLVKGNNDIYKSLDSFTEKDVLKSDSKYDSENQLIQVQFYSLPKVLHIHLRRFVYSQELCRTNKVNDYFAFPENLDLSPYVFRGEKTDKKKTKKDESAEAVAYTGECNYALYGVIVHQGKSSYMGHYYSYLKLNPNVNENCEFDENSWYLFNDMKVKKVTQKEATTLNFGQKKKKTSNEIDDYDDDEVNCAYILLYVRKDCINEVFNVKNSEIKIPKNIMTCINSLDHPNATQNSSSQCFNTFTNSCTNDTIGFTLITEDCVRMNCKLGKAGIDNRLLCQRVNVPFNQFFNFSGEKKKNKKGSIETFSIGGLYATISVFLNVDLESLFLWTVTSSYEIGEQLNRLDFEINKEMEIEQIDEIKKKTNSEISPHVIFVEIKRKQNEHEETEDTNETEDSSTSSSRVKNHISIVTKLYTRDLQCPMLYTGILSNVSQTKTLQSIVKNHYKERLCEIAQKEKYFSLINRMKFDVYYEKKKSNVKSDADLIKLDLSKSLKANHVPKGSFLIFSVDTIEENEQNELFFDLMSFLINNDFSEHNNYNFKSSKTTSNDSVVHRFGDMMLSECPKDPVDFCNLFTNTETFEVYRYFDNHYFGKVELPSRISLNKLSDFISFQFDTKYDKKDFKMLFFGDGPTLRPIDVSRQSDSAFFQITENFRKSFYFSVVPKTFKYSELCFTLSVVFSIDSISKTQTFNFFVETLSEEEADEMNSKTKSAKNSKQSQIPINPYSKKAQTQPQLRIQNQLLRRSEEDGTKAETYENILKKVVDTQKKIGLSDVRCFLVSKETGQIVSDFIVTENKRKTSNNVSNYVQEKDVLVLNRSLRVEVIPNDQKSAMKSIIKAKQKSKEDEDYLGYRLEVYKSYVEENFEEDEDGNIVTENSLPLLTVFDFPFVLVNVENNVKVKKLKDQISLAFTNKNAEENNDYLSIKYASLFMPRLEDNLFGNKNRKNGSESDDYQDDEEEETKVKLTRSDYRFAFKASQILKNDDKVHLEKNQPNKLFLVYSQDRALGNANEGVVFY